MSTNSVTIQYNNWIYPSPIDDLDIAIQNGYWEIGDPELYWPLFWPHKRHANNLNVLVAGCGTNQAAYYAYQNPTWNVLGIDLSDNSIANQQKLKEKHHLKNLRLLKFDLENISNLDETFDFITSTGVLHHLKSPESGLIQLRHVLRPNGVINLMLYGHSLRIGVYILQEFFRELGLKQNDEGIEIVKSTLNLLPVDHVINRYISRADDLACDAGIVDTFLHTVDHSYWTKDIFKLIRRSGLEFLTWCDPGEYALENLIPQSHPLWNKLANIDAKKKAHLRDLLMLERGTHRFAVAHPAYARQARIDYESESFFDCFVIPHRNSEVLIPSDPIRKNCIKLKRDHFEYEISYELGEIMARTNSDKSIRSAISSLQLDSADTERYFNISRAGFKLLAELGHIYILK